MSHLTATNRSPQPTPQTAVDPASVPSAPQRTVINKAPHARLPVQETPIDSARSNTSHSSLLPATARPRHGQRRTLQTLSDSLNKLHQPDQLTFQNLLLAMDQARSQKELLQSRVGKHDSPTNKALQAVKAEFLGILERVAMNLDQIEFPNSVEEVKKVLDGLGSLFASDATTTIFENDDDDELALHHLHTIHTRLLDHTLLLDLGPARPSAVLSIVNAISRCWKVGVIEPFDPTASALIVSLPTIAMAWTEDKLTLKDLGKSFVQLSAIMAYTTIQPASAQGQALRAMFNQLANSLGKLSGYKGMVEVDDESVAVCIDNISRAFANAVDYGYFELVDIAAAQDLFKTQLDFIAQSTRTSSHTRSIALQALERLERWSVARAEPNRRDDGLSSESDEDELTSTVMSTTTTTTTITSTSTATATELTRTTTNTTNPTTIATRPAPTSPEEQARRLQALKLSTPRTILETISQNSNFDILFESVTTAGESGLKMLFGLGKVKELEAIAGFTPFLRGIWDADKDRFGLALDTLDDAVLSQKNPAAHRQWLETVQHTFDSADPIHSKIATLLNRIDAVAQSQARILEAGASQTRRRHQAPESETPRPSADGAGVAGVAGVAGGDVPKNDREVQNPFLQRDDEGNHDIKVSDLIEQGSNASGIARKQLEAQPADTFERRGVAGFVRAALHQEAPRLPAPKSRSQPARPQPIQPLDDLPAPSWVGSFRLADAGWLLAHGIFGAALYQTLLSFRHGHVVIRGPDDVQAHIDALVDGRLRTRNVDSVNAIGDPEGILQTTAPLFEAYLRELQRLGNVVPLSESDGVRPTWQDLVALLSAFGLVAIWFHHYRRH
ncbi:hypothetical protein [Hydrogenophaga sp.]|uniref:hypothetical protein n=1 Tax=Hydrogenophaga sp. TaxID=1904254 RepID=UPI00272309E0|nr:hypothetical protein [Hydrogenophaga sp.]MDO9436085.1 hypothetical protein [Hydrogenophaga sp.]